MMDRAVKQHNLISRVTFADNSLWRYSIGLVVIRYLLPIAIVVLLALTGIDLTNVGIPVLSAILAAAVAGRGVARSAGRMPTWHELLVFAVPATFVFFVVNYVAYFLLAVSGIGPIQLNLFDLWHADDQIVHLMVFLTSVAFLSNSAVFPLAIKAELRAMARRTRKVQGQ